MKINYFKVEIRPWESARPDENILTLEIQVQTETERYTKKHVCHRDDLISRFDILFDAAKEILKREINKTEAPTAKNEPQKR